MKNTVNLQKSIAIQFEKGKRMTGRWFLSEIIMTISTLVFILLKIHYLVSCLALKT